MKWYSTPSPNLSPYIFLRLDPSPPPLHVPAHQHLQTAFFRFLLLSHQNTHKTNIKAHTQTHTHTHTCEERSVAAGLGIWKECVLQFIVNHQHLFFFFKGRGVVGVGPYVIQHMCGWVCGWMVVLVAWSGAAVCCSMLQCVAAVHMRCFDARVNMCGVWNGGSMMLQSVAVCCSVLQCIAGCLAVCCCMSQYVAGCCRVLQCVAVVQWADLQADNRVQTIIYIHHI